MYILTNKYNKVLYVGVTSDLIQRINKHRSKKYGGFSAKYNVDKLVYWEEYGGIEEAIEREKQIKAGSRKKKIDLVSSINSEWEDLYDDLL